MPATYRIHKDTPTDAYELEFEGYSLVPDGFPNRYELDTAQYGGVLRLVEGFEEWKEAKYEGALFLKDGGGIEAMYIIFKRKDY